ncbi:hypothetical protein [Thalassotalea sediminis]|uniref:hypothetical protein n=1 Tax=Thalassotalea sediminis TaxID=1759089 RepID=UPI0025741EE0|nr:hypothetical protein [Thalassotalea sediminis]
MNLKFLTKNKKIRQLLSRYVGYIADKCYELKTDGFSTLTNPRFIMIVARQHYVESVKTYSAISRKELNSLLKIQRQAVASIKPIQLIRENKEQDGFDVKTINFNKSLENQLNKKTLLIPEGELLKTNVNKQERKILNLNTPAGNLFWAYSDSKVQSAYQKGMLSDIAAFKASIGVPLNTPHQTVEQEKYANYLLERLELLPMHQYKNIVSINLLEFLNTKLLHSLYVIPVLTATCFLLFANGYYYLKQGNIQKQNQSLSQEARTLISNKQQLDALQNRLVILNEEFSRFSLVTPMWDIFSVAIENGMEISGYFRTSSGIELRGRAEKASRVLNALNNLGSVSQASFVGAVRKSRGDDLFTISLNYRGTE